MVYKEASRQRAELRNVSCPGGNPESNTLISDMTTVICLDDYHALDRNGRKKEGVTALDPKAQDFELMYNQIKDLKERKSVDKPIYNHVSGLLDPAESIKPPPVSPFSLPITPLSQISCATPNAFCLE